MTDRKTSAISMKKTYLYHLVAATVLLMHLNPADAASDSYIKERAKGWFWYETKTEPESISETDTDTLPQLSPVPRESSSARKNAGNIIISSRPAVHSGSDSSLNKPQELRNRHSGIAAEIRLSSDIRRLGEKEIDAYLDKLPRAPDGSLHAGDLRLILPRVLELAVDHPDEANITRYFSLQQMSMNKSENFAKTARELVMFNTELDEMPGALKSQQQKETDMEMHNEVISEKLAELGRHTGLLYIYRGDCPYCRIGVQNMNILARTGMKIIGISVDGVMLEELESIRNITAPEAVTEYRITEVPSIVAVSLDEETIPPVTVAGGLINLNELKFRLLKLAEGQ